MHHVVLQDPGQRRKLRRGGAGQPRERAWRGARTARLVVVRLNMSRAARRPASRCWWEIPAGSHPSRTSHTSSVKSVKICFYFDFLFCQFEFLNKIHEI